MSRPLVLIVDDEPLITSMLSMILDLSLDAEIVTSNSPSEARKILQQQTVSLLVTDYLMPELNGISLIRALREQGSMIPVILLTGYCDEPELASNTELLKPFEVIVKPWNNEKLVTRIEFLLNSNSQPAI